MKVSIVSHWCQRSDTESGFDHIEVKQLFAGLEAAFKKDIDLQFVIVGGQSFQATGVCYPLAEHV